MDLPKYQELALEDSFELSVKLLMGSIIGCYLLGVAFKNYSFVDRVWSVCPVVNVWVFLLRSPYPL